MGQLQNIFVSVWLARLSVCGQHCWKPVCGVVPRTPPACGSASRAERCVKQAVGHAAHPYCLSRIAQQDVWEHCCLKQPGSCGMAACDPRRRRRLCWGRLKSSVCVWPV